MAMARKTAMVNNNKNNNNDGDNSDINDDHNDNGREAPRVLLLANKGDIWASFLASACAKKLFARQIRILAFAFFDSANEVEGIQGTGRIRVINNGATQLRNNNYQSKTISEHKNVT